MATPSRLTNRRAISDEKSTIIINFGRQIKNLIHLATNIMPDNVELHVIKRAADRVISSIGNVLIEEVGPELWEYRNQISAEDFSFVQYIDFNKQIDSRKHLVSDDSDTSKYKNIISITLSSYTHCNLEEKKSIHNIVKKMLKEYVKYLIHCKTYKD